MYLTKMKNSTLALLLALLVAPAFMLAAPAKASADSGDKLSMVTSAHWRGHHRAYHRGWGGYPYYYGYNRPYNYGYYGYGYPYYYW
jgi:hypothetical protein